MNHLTSLGLATLCILALGLQATGPAGASEPAGPDEPTLSAAVDHLKSIARKRGRKVMLWSLAGRDGWLFMDQELNHLAAGRFWGPDARRASRVKPASQRDPLPAILDYRDRLKALGIELIMVPIPPKAIIYPDMLVDMIRIPLLADGRLPRLDPEHQEFYSLLRQKGLTVFDPTDLLLQNRFGVAGPMYCKQDHHYSGQAIALLAPQLAKLIKNQPWYSNLASKKEPLKLESEQRDITISGDLWQTYKLKVKKAPEREVLRLEFIGQRDAAGELQPMVSDPHSPVLLFGGSHCLIFHSGGDMHARGSGMVDHLARELGFAIDLVATRGDMSHNPRISIHRRARKDPSTITSKKVFVWLFSARAFTTGRWSDKIPLLPDQTSD